MFGKIFGLAIVLAIGAPTLASAAGAPPEPMVRVNVNAGQTVSLPASQALLYADGTVKVGTNVVCHGTISYQDGFDPFSDVKPFHNYQSIPINANVFPATAKNDMGTKRNNTDTTNVATMGRMSGSSPCAAQPGAAQVSADLTASPSKSGSTYYIGTASVSDSSLTLLGLRDDRGNVFLFRRGDVVPFGSGFKVISNDGGSLVASGAGNLVASGAGNLVASGAGNLVASGAGNLVASGAGNLVASGAGNILDAAKAALVASGAGNLVAQGAGNVVSTNGSNLTGIANSTKLISQDGNGIISEGGYGVKPTAPRYGVQNFPGTSTGTPPQTLAPIAAGAEVNICKDGRISSAFVAMRVRTGNQRYTLPPAAGADNTVTNGRCDPALYAGGRYDGNSINDLVLHSLDCPNRTMDAAEIHDSAWIGEALFELGFTPQAFTGCDEQHYIQNGGHATSYDDMKARVRAYATAVANGTANQPQTVDKYGCKNGSYGVAVFTSERMFFGNYQDVPNLNLAVADSFTCSNALPPGLYRGDPNSIPLLLQRIPTKTNSPSMPPGVYGTVDAFGCKDGNYPVAVYSKEHLFFGNYKTVANLNLAVADSLTCSNAMPPGLYRGDPNAIPLSLQMSAAGSPKRPCPMPASGTSGTAATSAALNVHRLAPAGLFIVAGNEGWVFSTAQITAFFGESGMQAFTVGSSRFEVTIAGGDMKIAYNGKPIGALGIGSLPAGSNPGQGYLTAPGSLPMRLFFQAAGPSWHPAG
ncbi:MAG: hypothetical protein NVSMB64_10050 [Candidatus Velthaea sp.]